MKSIRRNTFETNSSSTHSITIKDDTLTNCDLTIEDLSYNGNYYKGPAWEDSCLMVELTGFCGYNDHRSQNDRLALCCLLVIYQVLGESLHCMSQEEWDTKVLEVYESDAWKELEEDIRQYVNCSCIRIYQYSEGYIDHDSLDCYEEDKRLQSFLTYHGFSSAYSYVFAKNIITHFEFCG